MNLLNNPNPDYYEFIRNNGTRKERVIYSTLENINVVDAKSTIANGVNVNSGQDLCIYADTLTIYGNISIPGGNLKIIARKLILGAGAKVRLDITPNPIGIPNAAWSLKRAFAETPENKLPRRYNAGYVQDPPNEPNGYKLKWFEIPGKSNDNFYKGANGAKGKNGDNAGTIYIMVQEFEKNGQTIELIANGGNGQAGQQGMDGPITYAGSDGFGYFQTYNGKEGLVELEDWLKLSHGKVRGNWANWGDDGAIGGDGGQGGDGGKGGKIWLYGPASLIKGGFSLYETSNGNHGKDGEVGKGSEGKKGGKFQIKMATRSFIDYYEDGRVITMRDGQPGADGKKYQRPKADPSVIHGTPLNVYNVSMEMLLENFHSDFLLKLLQRAKNLYLYAPPKSKNPSNAEKESNGAYRILFWLTGTLGVMELKPKLAEDKRKYEIYKSANTLLNNFNKGKSLFGKPINWVPRLSLQEYQKILNNTIQPFTTIESKFLAQYDKVRLSQDKQTKIKEALANIEANKSIISAKIDWIKPEMIKAGDMLDVYTKELQNQLDGLKEIIRITKEAIKNYRDCSFANILKALEMMAFEGSGMMAGVQAGNLIYKSMTEINGVKKDSIIKDIDNLNYDRNDDEIMLTSIAGKINADDSGTKLLLADLKSFENSMVKFQKALPKGGQDLKNATANIKNIVQKRGKAIIEYNARVSLLMKYMSELDTLTSKNKELENAETAGSDPTALGLESHYAVMYQSVRESIMELVYDTERALAFWSVNEAKVEKGFEFFRQKSLWVQQASPSQFTSTDLNAALVLIMKKMSTHEERLSSPKTVFKDFDGNKSELVINIMEAETIKSFQTTPNPSLSFRTVHESEDPGDDEYTIENAEGLKEIRVTYIRPRLIFKTPASGEKIDIGSKGVIFTIQYLGTSDILYPSAGIPAEYQHSPLMVGFTQLFEYTGKHDHNPNGGSLIDEQKNIFAPIGIYGDWMITIDRNKDMNKNLNLDQLESICIEFGANAYE